MVIIMIIRGVDVPVWSAVPMRSALVTSDVKRLIILAQNPSAGGRYRVKLSR